MTQADKARAFADLHVPGKPLLLYNIWDAGGAKAVADGGAKAIATGSWSVAGAHGYADGEKIPLDLVLRVLARITATVELPVTLDFEGCYAKAPEDAAANVRQVIDAGAIGINFEDQIIGGEGLFTPEEHSRRVAAVRRMAAGLDIPFFINARTDLFLKERDRSKHADLVPQAIERADVYAEAGASGFFVPALVDPDLIAKVVQATSLPVNIMMMGGAPSVAELGSLGVARISYGPGPYRLATANLTKQFQDITGGA